ncbi:MAG: carbohydrate ABC transporter permease [Spirochaetales bacterium]|nr:carbohydrate ABC transporter permease [Spirochaetales bacterium]
MIKSLERISWPARLTLVVLLAIMTIPLLWGVSLSFRSNTEIAAMSGFGIQSFIPEHFTIINYQNFFSSVNFLRVLATTLYVCGAVTLASVLTDAMAAFAFARMRFPGRDILFSAVLATMILPLELLIIPLYSQVRDMGMINKLSGIIIPFTANGFGIFFLRQFIKGVPNELEEAATIDGCGRWRLFGQIILPLCRTALITLGTIQFLAQWDGFLVPVTFISEPSKAVLQVVLADLHSGVYFNDYGILYAGITVGSLPIILLFVFIQKYYMDGIASTGIKG